MGLTTLLQPGPHHSPRVTPPRIHFRSPRRLPLLLSFLPIHPLLLLHNLLLDNLTVAVNYGPFTSIISIINVLNHPQCCLRGFVIIDSYSNKAMHLISQRLWCSIIHIPTCHYASCFIY
jgi:hypothetical protein